MEYTIKKLAQMSGVSTRTLRYYDEIGLLCPTRISSNGYRIYGQKEIDLLQQILFYRELGMSLKEIDHILKDPEFDRENALYSHLSALLLKKSQIELLIDNVSRTISAMKGECVMHDREKFEGFKQKMVDDNEAKYGKEIREKYGDKAVDESNSRVKGMSEAKWQQAQELSELINRTLKEAFEEGDPAGETAQKACALHKEWLCMFWPEGMYSPQAHKILAESYVADERFTAYYDKIAAGCAKFLRDAICIYCGEE
ncbi:MAG: MerR family transcriptional regulator [Lachnospiraceae bacterium]|nr:MerR family transcriptional regulator [Lachnospiraceae bacterium]